MQRAAHWQDDRIELPTAPTSALDHAFPQFLFLAIVASIPYFRYRQLPGPEFMKVDWLLTGLLLLIILPYLVIQKLGPGRLQSNLWGPLGMFLVANLAASLLSPFPAQSIDGMIILLQAGIFLTIVMLMVNQHCFETTLPWTIALSMGVAAWMSNLGFFFGVEEFAIQVGGGLDVRGAGATIGANNMAIMCVFAMPIVMHIAVFAGNLPIRVFGMFLVVSLILAIVSTGSRGGFLNLFVVLGLLGLQYRRYFQIRYFGLLVAGVTLSLMSIVAFIPAEYFARQATLVTEGTQDQSLDRRASYVKVGVDAWQEKPILGWGANAFPEVWVSSIETRWFKMEQRPAHNTYIEVLVATGIVGFFIWGFLLLRAYLNYLETEKIFKSLGDDKGAQLAAAYRIGLLAMLSYFLIKSGLDHKYFLIALPVSQVALNLARDRLAEARARGLANCA